MPSRPVVRVLDAAAAEARLHDLAAILVDAVCHGASVNFMRGFTPAGAAAFWRGQLPGLADGSRRLLVAEDGRREDGAQEDGSQKDGAQKEGARLLGTVVLSLAPQPNAPHRAEIGKMLVHSAVRRRGVGRLLLAAAENAALGLGRTLLLLDTEAGSAGEQLYRACGWHSVGTVPDHAFRPDGRLAPTAVLYKVLGPHRAPPGGHDGTSL